VPCQKSTDQYGTTYTILAADAVKTPGKQFRPGCPAVEMWWSRNGKKADETIVIRQEYPDRATADVIELTFGQLYDLIDAANQAVESA
jgi:hypothetical protein